jgi:hypothetical protein
VIAAAFAMLAAAASVPGALDGPPPVRSTDGPGAPGIDLAPTGHRREREYHRPPPGPVPGKTARRRAKKAAQAARRKHAR